MSIWGKPFFGSVLFSGAVYRFTAARYSSQPFSNVQADGIYLLNLEPLPDDPETLEWVSVCIRDQLDQLGTVE